MAGELGVGRVNVNRLHKTAECDQQYAGQAQSPDGPAFARFVEQFDQFWISGMEYTVPV
jgi:hypothetical protein